MSFSMNIFLMKKLIFLLMYMNELTGMFNQFKNKEGKFEENEVRISGD